MMRVGAIDCGTNSIRLLVADVDLAAGSLVDCERRMEVVRLGAGVDRTGRIAPDALARTLDAARRYSAVCGDLGVERIRFVATSASRDAENRQDFVDGVRDALGIEPEVIGGEEEAALSFRGATASLAGRSGQSGKAGKLPGPFLVVDLGGGSTEFVLGTTSPVAAASIDVGCVRLTERHLHDDPPSPEQIAAATADVDAALGRAAAIVPFGRTATLVGLAGTVTTVTAHALKLKAYDPDRIHGTQLPVDAVLASCADLLGRTRAERAALPFMHAGRVDVIGAGALIWSDVVARVRSDVAIAGGRLRYVVTSEHDILDGIAWSIAD